MTKTFIPTAELVASILTACDVATHAHYGLRIEDGRAFAAGDYLPDSRVWVDGEPTDETVDGVSTIGLGEEPTVEKIERALRMLDGYLGTNLVLVGGSRMIYGEDDGEHIIRDAQCVACW